MPARLRPSSPADVRRRVGGRAPRPGADPPAGEALPGGALRARAGCVGGGQGAAVRRRAGGRGRASHARYAAGRRRAGRRHLDRAGDRGARLGRGRGRGPGGCQRRTSRPVAPAAPGGRRDRRAAPDPATSSTRSARWTGWSWSSGAATSRRRGTRPTWSCPTTSARRAALARLDAVAGLRVVQLQTAGYDGVLELMPDGVVLASARGVHDDATAELALGLTIASLRGIDVAVREAGTWHQDTRRRSLADSRVAILGYGSIGRAVAERMVACRAVVTGVASAARDDDLVGRVVTADDGRLGGSARRGRRTPAERRDAARGRRGVPGPALRRRARGQRRSRPAARHRRRAGRGGPAAASPSTSPTPSRCPTAIRSGPPPACSSRPTSPAVRRRCCPGSPPWSATSSNDSATAATSATSWSADDLLSWPLWLVELALAVRRVGPRGASGAGHKGQLNSGGDDLAEGRRPAGRCRTRWRRSAGRGGRSGRGPPWPGSPWPAGPR